MSFLGSCTVHPKAASTPVESNLEPSGYFLPLLTIEVCVKPFKELFNIPVIELKIHFPCCHWEGYMRIHAQTALCKAVEGFSS